MKKLLWIIQGLLVFVFCGAGAMKISQPIDVLAVQMNWMNYFQPWMIRSIGIAEILCGMLLILPVVIKLIPSQLIVLAGAGLSILMIGAVGTHILLGEFDQLMPATILLLLSVFVALKRKSEL
jgi:hypothetical protein|tara:strand:+ start:36 stop:404 length:369 start_codon:yes stop_codon:yes gene_type:complete